MAPLTHGRSAGPREGQGAYFLRWSKTLWTPVFSDGLEAFVFGFSFFGLRISRFDFCCLDMGMVTSHASQPAMRFAPESRASGMLAEGRDSAGMALPPAPQIADRN